MITLLVFIIILAILIITHELGHFAMAKKFGIRVDEFGFGFPPKIFGWKKGETTYSLNLIPVGGFVKIYGEDPDEESTNGPDSGRSLVNKSRWVQAGVLVAGVTLNIVLAWLLISLNLSLGMPISLTDVPSGAKVTNAQLLVTNVLKNSPAEKAGLLAGDSLIKLTLNDDVLTNPEPETVKDFVNQYGDKNVAVTYLRKVNGVATTSVLTVVPKTGVVGNLPSIGIAMEKAGIVQMSWWQSLYYGAIFTYDLTRNTVIGFKYFVTSIFTDGSSALKAVSGPIGLFGMVGDANRMGLVYLINFMALISINLAVLNLLPFPALDGGRLLFLAIEGIRNKRLNPKIANTLNLIGFGLLMLLMAVVAYSDIAKIF
ncbi:MAG: RIP metalloprotease RseP [Candidatus Vogelbacteria bacterium]|nr:RIP metalloprotease RseP [Candidatus Vogelbacteria bacterium]